MVEQVWHDPDIYRILVELPQSPLRTLNVYVLRTPVCSMVVDTGFNRPECRRDLWAGLRELDLDLNRTVLFLTHLHSDHSGLVWDFVERNIPVYTSRIDHTYSSYTLSGMVWPDMEALYRKEGYPEDELALQKDNNQARLYAPKAIYPAHLVEDGATLSVGGVTVQCIHTPGHTPGHMVLYLPKAQLLFAGDHILYDITPNIGIWKGVPYSLADYLDSLKKVKALPIQAAFPGHRERRPDVYGRIDAILQHHDARLAELYQAVSAHPDSTAFQLAGSITWSSRGLGWANFPPHQKWFAVSETLAHLYELDHRGQVVRSCVDGQYRYRALK